MSEGIELPPLEKDIALSLKEFTGHLDANLAVIGSQIMAVRPMVANNVLCGLDRREDQLRDAMKRIAELESQQAADREDLAKADYLIGRCLPFIDTLIHHGNKEAKVLRELITEYAKPAAAEGGR